MSNPNLQLSPSGTCTVCGTYVGDRGQCPNCGSGGDGGAGVLGLVGWIFVPLVAPIYPIAGTLGTIALVATPLLFDQLGFAAFGLLMAPVAVYATLYFTFRYEQRAARSRAYRIARNVLRLALASGVAYWAVTRAGTTLSPANALFIAVIGVPLGYWVVTRLDRIFKAAGPRRATKAERQRGAPEIINDDTELPRRPLTFWNTLNYPAALIVGFMAGCLFALTGGFNLFAGALAWIVVAGVFLGAQVLFRLLASAGRAVFGRRS